MKKSITTTIFFFGMLLIGHSQKVNSETSIVSDGKKGKTIVTINDRKGSLRVDVLGEIIFNDEETKLEHLSPGGYVKFNQNGKKLTAEIGNSGLIYYTYNDGGKTAAMSDEGNAFLAKAIQTMISYGIGAKGRAEKLYKKGGIGMVLSMIDELKSDYTKSIYLEYLFSLNNLSQQDAISIIAKITSVITSDYEKTKLLKLYAAGYLKNPETAAPYLNAIKGIQSDYEKANAVKHLLNNQLTTEQFIQVMEVAGAIQSDYEKANVLKEILEQPGLSSERFDRALAVSNTIESDFEKANVLKHLISKGLFSGESFGKLLNSIAQIDSDFERANIFKELAGNGIKTEQQWIELMNSAALIDSDFEKSNVLIAISKKMPRNETVKATFMKAAKTISSDNEYGKVVRNIQ